MRVRSRSSRRHPPIQRSAVALMRGRLDVAEHGPDPGVGEDGVERVGEVGSAVAGHELEPVSLLAEVHEEAAGLLGGPLPGGIQGGPEDADAPGRVLDHGQDVGLGAAGQVDREEVARQDRLGLGVQELRPARPALPGGVDSTGLEDLPYSRCRDADAQASQLAVNPAVPPVGILASQPPDQGLDVPSGRRPAGPGLRGPGGPAAADDVPVPAQDRVRGNQQPQAPAPRFGYHGEQGRKQSAVCPVQPRAALPPLQDGELMAQDQDLRGPPRSSRWDRRSHAATRVIRRNTNRRHIIGDHHGWTAERATLLLRAVDNILGTHSFH